MAKSEVLINPRTDGAPAWEGVRVSWGGVWSGLLVGLGLLLLLSSLGLAIGIAALDEQTGASDVGWGAGLWAGLSLLVSLFVGGMVASRMGMVYDRATGFIQGTLVWVLATLGILYMASSGVTFGVSTLFGALGGAAQGISEAVTTGNAELSDLSQGDVNEILARLRDPQTVELVSAATGMSSAETQSTLSSIAQRVEAAKDDPSRALAEAREGVQQLAGRAAGQAKEAIAKAEPYAVRAAWITFLVLLLSLLAAVFGSMTGSGQATSRASSVRSRVP